MADYHQALLNAFLAGQPDGETYDTRNVLAGMPKSSRLTDALRSAAEGIPENPDAAFSVLNMVRGGMNSAANWLDWKPEVGRDTLAPLGLAAMAPFGATGAVGAFGGRLPKPDAPRVWYHGSQAPEPFAAFDPAKAGSVNGGFGGVWLAPRIEDAEGYASPKGHVREVHSGHQKPFHWDMDALSDTLKRAREVWPEFDVAPRTDVWHLRGPDYTNEFVNRLKGAGFDAIDKRMGGKTHEMVVLDPSLLKFADDLTPPRIPNPIKAYHGSPHDFDKFDMGKIGTGEGAQAYGHGLYFAEREGVARSYRDALSNQHYTAAREGVDPKALEYLNAYADRGAGRPMADELRDLVLWTRRMQHQDGPVRRSNDKFNGARYEDMENAFRSLKPEDIQTKSGKMYEVNLHATPEQFLDWDKPLSGQSPAVRSAVDPLLGDPARQAHYFGGKDWKGADEIPRAMMLIGRNHREKAGRPIDVRNGADHPDATQALREAGIPGIRYLDQGSRGRPVPRQTPELTAIEQKMDAAWSAAERQSTEAIRRLHDSPEWKALEAQRATAIDNASGTRNYVVWTPEIIEILRKYGLLGPVAAPIVTNALSGNEE